MKILSLRSTFAFQISHTTPSNDPKNKILLYIHSDLLRKLMKINACISSADFSPAIFLPGVYSACTLLPLRTARSSGDLPRTDLVAAIKIRVSEHSRSLAPLALLRLPSFSPQLVPFFLPSILHPRHSSSILLAPPFLMRPPPPPPPPPPPFSAPAPSLTQGPCVPVCNISKAVRRPGQGKQPSFGFRGDGGRDVFPREPRDPRGLLAGAREGLRGEDDPRSCPPQERRTLFFLSLSISIFHLLPFVSLSSSSPSSRCFRSFSFYICVHKALQRHLLHTCTIIHQHPDTLLHFLLHHCLAYIIQVLPVEEICIYVCAFKYTLCSIWEMLTS